MQAHKAKENPMEWLEMEDIYGELGKSPEFYAAFAKSLEAIWTKGTSKVLHEFLTN
jgi:mannitol 2-dehydrogenase